MNNEATPEAQKGQNREALAAFLLRLRSNGITDTRILNAFEAVPRRNFVPVIHITNAYARGAMPIECGQIMTAADVQAKILKAVDVEPDHRVLELGTGTGYQTALLANLCTKVTSLERFRTLHEKAKIRLENLSIKNALLSLADATTPPEELGTFDRIVATCAFEEQPKQYLDYLSNLGQVLAPIGPADDVQMMTRFTKVGVRYEAEPLFEVRVQPFVKGVAKSI